MDTKVKNFFFFLLGAVILVVIIFIVEFKQFRAITTQAVVTPLIADTAIDIPTYTTDPVFGNPGADLVVTEFIDMSNIASRNFHIMLYRFAQSNPTKVRIVWKDFPQKHLFSGDSTAAHIAAACANTQGKFWPFIDALFTTKTNLNQNDLAAIAQKVGVNIPLWQKCISSGSMSQAVTNNVLLAPTVGVAYPPAVFINNKRLDTTQNIDYLQLLTSLISS